MATSCARAQVHVLNGTWRFAFLGQVALEVQLLVPWSWRWEISVGVLLRKPWENGDWTRKNEDFTKKKIELLDLMKKKCYLTKKNGGLTNKHCDMTIKNGKLPPNRGREFSNVRISNDVNQQKDVFITKQVRMKPPATNSEEFQNAKMMYCRTRTKISPCKIRHFTHKNKQGCKPTKSWCWLNCGIGQHVCWRRQQIDWPSFSGKKHMLIIIVPRSRYPFKLLHWDDCRQITNCYHCCLTTPMKSPFCLRILHCYSPRPKRLPQQLWRCRMPLTCARSGLDATIVGPWRIRWR